MAYTLTNLTDDIKSFTEVDSNVLTSTITNQFIENSEFKILRDIPIDASKKQKIGNFVTGETQ